MSPILTHEKVNFASFEARVVADWKKAWREVEDWRGDPQPRMYFARENGGMHMHKIPFEWFNSREHKDEMTARFILIIKQGNCHLFGFCNTMMTFRMDPDDPDFAEATADPTKMPAAIAAEMDKYGADNLTELQVHRPDLILEQAAIAIVDREVGIGHSAFIKRKKGTPPRLTDWHRGEVGGGLIFGPVQEALR